MAVPRERLRDGASVLSTYEFDINHDAEEPAGQTHNISRTAPTGGVGFVRQQGDVSPRVIRNTGSILRQEQIDAMQDYFDACSNRTVFYRDVDGTEYEVIITVFDYTRVRGHNRRGGLPYKWTYRLEMEIIA